MLTLPGVMVLIVVAAVVVGETNDREHFVIANCKQIQLLINSFF